MEEPKPKQRVIAYVDGFNLYYGLCEAGFRRFLWLNIRQLAEKLIRDDQEVIAVKYFTSRISGGRPNDRPIYRDAKDAKQKRQSAYLDALVASGVEIFYGQYRDNQAECLKCGATWNAPQEKMTDVNIAVEMLVDAHADNFDVALLISGDSDLVPPIRAIKSLFSTKRVNVAFPPARPGYQLKQVAHGQCVIGRSNLKKSQFPDEIRTINGFLLKKPSEWI